MREYKKLHKLLEKLKRESLHTFPAEGPSKNVRVPEEQGVYIIYSRKDIVLHVGRTVRRNNGLAGRLDNHLYGNSTFARNYLKGRGFILRKGYKFRYLVEKNDRARALLEALAIGMLCPKYIGLGSKVCS